MWLSSRHRREIDAIRYELAALSVKTKLIRLGRSLSRKYSADQPRAPAGQSDGGQWVSDGGGDTSIGHPPHRGGQWASLGAGSDPDAAAMERTVTEDGGKVLSIRIRAGRGAWDEQHTVIAPDGESRIFETSGATQTIRDGQSGEVLSRATLTASGIEPEATVQPAFLPALIPAAAAAATLRLGAILFAVQSARKDGFGTALGMTARQYDFEPSSDKDFRLAWVGPVDQATLEAACPRHAEVQAATDEAYARLTALNPLLAGKELGNQLHIDLAGNYKVRDDPNMIPELSIDESGKKVYQGKKYSLRLDLFERTPTRTACVYDFKTGDAELDGRRALKLAQRARMHFPDLKNIIMVQVKPHKPKGR